MMKLTVFAVLATLSPLSVLAECKVWHYHDTSNAIQKRAMVFATADIKEKDKYIAQGLAIAKNLASQNQLDYVDVFMTRPQDGQKREKHNAMTSAAAISYNPGNTPLNQGKRLSATALTEPETAQFKYSMFGSERVDFDAATVETIAAEQKDNIDLSCK